MTNLYKEIYNCETGELTQVDLTPEEIAIYEAEALKNQAELEAIQQKNIARQAVINKLGLTADEVAALLG